MFKLNFQGLVTNYMKSSKPQPKVGVDLAVMGGNKQLKNCTRVAIMGHMVFFLIVGMCIGYTMTVVDIDRTQLEAEITDYSVKVDMMLHFVNETNRLWRGVDMESQEITLNNYEFDCFEHGFYPEVKNQNTRVIENVMIPFKKRFNGVTDSFLPCTNLLVNTNPISPIIDDSMPTSQITFWNTVTRGDMILVQFEGKEFHKIDKKTLCYFAYQREKRRG